jgi:3-oxoadipate CoA-transferase, beta subunit
LLTKNNESKLVEKCSYPLTGLACVKRVYTDLATFACTELGLQLIDAVEGLSREALERIVGLPIAPMAPVAPVVTAQ